MKNLILNRLQKKNNSSQSANTEQTAEKSSSQSKNTEQTTKNSTNQSAGTTSSTTNTQSSVSAPSDSKTTTTTKKADYNLNDRYVYAYVNVPFYTDETYTTVAEYKYFLGIEKFSGSSVGCGTYASQVAAYAKAKGYAPAQGCGVVGGLTWEQMVSEGKALDEAACARFGLSCGRW